jgi:hypothetical protein
MPLLQGSLSSLTPSGGSLLAPLHFSAASPGDITIARPRLGTRARTGEHGEVKVQHRRKKGEVKLKRDGPGLVIIRQMFSLN